MPVGSTLVSLYPSVPTITAAVYGNAQVTLTWTAPLYPGASPITGYRIIPYIVGVAQAPIDIGNVLTYAVAGTNGTAYTYTVTARNSLGLGTASAPSASATPRTTPGAPTSPTATSNEDQLTHLTWVAPASNGGATITGYRITPFIGATAQATTTIGVSLTLTLTGLTNGVTYTFKINAINSEGNGALSVATSAVTPAKIPTAVTSLSSVAASGGLTFTWSAPASNGGSAITSYGYEVRRASDNVVVASGTATSPKTVTGLVIGTAVYARVWAVNGVGAGPTTDSNSVTPTATAPAAVTIGTLTPDFYGSPSANRVTAHWTNNSNGGSAMTGGNLILRKASDNSLVGNFAFVSGVIVDYSQTDPTIVTGVPVYAQIIIHNVVGDSPVSGNSNTVTPT